METKRYYKEYREKLRLALSSFGLSKSSIIVYLAGSHDKKPNGDIRYAISNMQDIQHPFNAWGTNIKEACMLKAKELKQKEQECQTRS